MIRVQLIEIPRELRVREVSDETQLQLRSTRGEIKDVTAQLGEVGDEFALIFTDHDPPNIKVIFPIPSPSYRREYGIVLKALKRGNYELECDILGRMKSLEL